MCFKAITDLYHTLKPTNCQKRTNESVKKRIKRILQDYLFFVAHMATIRNNHPCGTNHDDLVHLAIVLLNKQDNSNVSDKFGPKFKYPKCWKVLEDHPKIELIHQHPPRNETSAEVQCANDGEASSGPAQASGEERKAFNQPIGRKRAKAIDARPKIESKRLKVVEATLSAQQERNEFIRTQQ